MFPLPPIRCKEGRHKITNKLILRFLRKCHPQQFESQWCWTLTDIMDEASITGETKLIIVAGKPVQLAIFQALHSQCVNRFNLMSLGAQSGNKFSGQVFVQQDLHAGCGSCWRANSANTPRTASSDRLGYASTISGTVIPAASDSRMSATEIRVPRTRGLPPRCSGSATIHLFIHMNLSLFDPILKMGNHLANLTAADFPCASNPSTSANFCTAGSDFFNATRLYSTTLVRR